METYFLSIILLVLILVLGFLGLRFIFRVILDIYDLTLLIWEVKKNDTKYKRYNEEKSKNLEKERELRLQKHKDRQQTLGVEFDEDVEIFSISAEAPPEEHFWQSKIFRERVPLMRAIKEILKHNAADILKGGGGTIGIWKAKIIAEGKSRGSARQRGGK